MSEAAEFDQGLIDQAMGMLDPQQQNQRTDPGDKNLHVRFFHFPHPNVEKTAEAGRPIFDDREYIEIIVPGDKDNTVNRPVRNADKMRFPDHYQAFKRGASQLTVGTPLEAWPGITRAQVEEMKYFKIHTCEQLANLSDGLAQQFMGFQKLRQKARDFIDAAQGTAHTTQLRNALDEKDAQIAALQSNLAELSAAVGELQKGKRGKKIALPEPEPEEISEEEPDPEDR